MSQEQGTVRARLKIIEINDTVCSREPDEKEFCTKEDLFLLAEGSGLKEITAE